MVHLKRAILKNPFDFKLYISTNSSNNGAHLQFIWREIRVELFSSESFNWRRFECPFKSNSYEAKLAFSLCDKITSLKYCKQKHYFLTVFSPKHIQAWNIINHKQTRLSLSNQSFYFQNNLYHNMITCKKKSYINTYLITNFKTDFLYLKYIISIKDKSYEVIYI